MTIGNAGHEIPESALVSPVAPDALGAADVAIAAQLACLLEASAPKPGNVPPGRSFAVARYEDFLASAAAIGAPIGGAATRPLGVTVRLAVEATARWTPSNTNLGIVLLLAPLARAGVATLVEHLFALSVATPSIACAPGLVRELLAFAEALD